MLLERKINVGDAVQIGDLIGRSRIRIPCEHHRTADGGKSSMATVSRVERVINGHCPTGCAGVGWR
jgi:hypothetical protein